MHDGDAVSAQEAGRLAAPVSEEHFSDGWELSNSGGWLPWLRRSGDGMSRKSGGAPAWGALFLGDGEERGGRMTGKLDNTKRFGENESDGTSE